MQKINWLQIKAVVFDLDGTLYEQKKLRRYILVELLQYYALHLWRLQELKILIDFRKEREKNVFNLVSDIENAQYVWGAQASNVAVERVRNVVKNWIFDVPLKYLQRCRYPHLQELFDNLSKRDIVIIVFSDYPVKDKMSALGLNPHYIFCATDKGIDSLKPNPKGLFFISETLNIPIDKCLFIGDRDDRDGECARKAGMPYLILDAKTSMDNHRFQTYKQLNLQLEDYL